MKDTGLYIVIGLLAVGLFIVWQNYSQQVASLQAQLSNTNAALTAANNAVAAANGKVQQQGTTTGALTTLIENIF